MSDEEVDEFTRKLVEFMQPIIREFMEANFESWLESVKAEAWDRCVGEMPIDLDWKNLYRDNNPYREQNSEGNET